LVPGSFYNVLEDHESPVILKLSLRLQILSSCCAGSKAINDPKGKLVHPDFLAKNNVLLQNYIFQETVFFLPINIVNICIPTKRHTNYGHQLTSERL